MSLNKEQIVQDVKNILSEEQVVTDEEVLKANSIDRFRKYEGVHEVYTQPLPVAVVKVNNSQEISELLSYMNDNNINVVPRTGGSATEGGLETAVENSVVIDGSEMNEIVEIDPYNMLATVQCGVCLEELENKLRKQGLTTGHSPQSKPIAQMGGLVATRSIGQLSTLYGGIEDMLVGLEAVFPNGEITKIKNVPRRATGPDIRHVVIGNEGALCYVTEVTVKLFKYRPENHNFYTYLLDDMKTGFEILREVMVQGYRPSVARLYDPEDAEDHFSHFSKGKCVLIFMTEGPKLLSEATGQAIEEIVASFGDFEKVDSKKIQNWFENLNWDMTKITNEDEEIKETKHIGFTTEVSGTWDVINEIYERCLERIREEIPDLTMLGGHSSHSYVNGTNMYFVYSYNVVDIEPEEEITKYHYPIKEIIVEETLKAGGSMVHHHGVGKHRARWIKDEYGSSYYILNTLKEAFDPNDIMNHGTLFPTD